MKRTLTILFSTIMGMHPAIAQTGQFAEVNGLHMYYEIHGQGNPLVLIHGAASTIQTTFGTILPELAKKYQVIGVELQAHGHSDNRDGRHIRFEQDADDVVALLQRLHIERADFFGFSNGGTTVLQIAIRHPAMVKKLIIASSMYKQAGVAPEFWQGMKNAHFEDMPEAYKKAFLAINPSQDALMTMFNQCVYRMQHFTDIPDSLIHSIQARVLILAGDKDVPLPEHAVEMYRLMPMASLALFPGGHGDYMGEITTLKSTHHPAVALPVIEDFLDQE